MEKIDFALWRRTFTRFNDSEERKVLMEEIRCRNLVLEKEVDGQVGRVEKLEEQIQELRLKHREQVKRTRELRNDITSQFLTSLCNQDAGYERSDVANSKRLGTKYMPPEMKKRWTEDRSGNFDINKLMDVYKS